MSIDWRDVPYSKGFVLAREPLHNVAHFSETSLPGGWCLWTDEVNDTDIARSSSDDFVIIRGHWVDTVDDAVSGETAKQLLSYLVEDGEEQFLRRTAQLGGRFVIIVKLGPALWIYNDATGLRSVYYSRTRPLVASHLNLLLEIQPESATYSRRATMRALDETPYINKRQLLPNFRLHAETSVVERFFPFEKNRYAEVPPEERLRIVEKIWGRVMQHYLARTDKLAISITGGLDSRLMLAMCGSASERFSAYTYGFPEKTSSRAESLNFDYKQVQNMLPYLKFESHRFLDLTSRDPVSEDLEALITNNSRGKHGQYLVPLYRELFEGDGWYHLRGTGVEIIRRYWPIEQPGLRGLLRFLYNNESPLLEERARELGYDDEQYDYDLTDLVYWEIRVGKWHAEILNEQDAAFETFLPMSVREIYEILLAFPENERENAIAVYELINRNNPILNFWGANDVRNIYEQWRDERADSRKSGASQIAGARSQEHPDMLEGPSRKLLLPRKDFLAGNSTTTPIYVAKEEGTLSFVVDQPYRKSAAQGYFEWHITLDDEPVIRCDGAITASPTTVTVWNIPKDTKVGIALLAHRDAPSASWERASRLEVDSVRFYPGYRDGDEKVMVATDNPYAPHVQASADPTVSDVNFKAL